MIRVFSFAIVLALLSACAVQVPYFIPLSPLTAEEVENTKKELAEAYKWTLEQAADFVDDSISKFKYRDKDIRAAFPTLEDTDEQLSFCTNSMMSGATRITFTALPKGNKVVIKSSTCRQTQKGLQCKPLKPRELYFYKQPKNTFSTEAGASYQEAINILSIYEKKGIKGLPDWFQGFKPSNVNTIRKTTEGFHLSLGEVFCGGCTAQLHVKIENNMLVLLKEPEGFCI